MENGYWDDFEQKVSLRFPEMDRIMQQGYEYVSSKDEEPKAAAIWRQLFVEIKAYMDAHDLKSLEAFEDLFLGSEYLTNWAQDYDMLLGNLLRDCSEEERAAYGRERIEMLSFFLQLNASDDLTHLNNLQSLAETHYRMGDPDVGETLFRNMISSYPDHVWGYVAYSDEYWLEDTEIKDYDKAMRILNTAFRELTIVESDVIADRMTRLEITASKEALAAYEASCVIKPLPEGLTVAEALEYLKQDSGENTLAYLQFVEENQETAQPLILAELKRYLEDADHYAERYVFMTVYLPFILAQWEVKAASRDIADLAACSAQSADLRLGYMLTEVYPAILYKCFDGDTAYLQTLIESEDDIDEFSIVAYLDVLSMHYVVDLDDIGALLKLIRNHPPLITTISNVVLLHKRAELLDVGELCLRSSYYDPSYSGDRAEYLSHFYDKTHDQTKRLREPINAVDGLKGWGMLPDDVRPTVPDYDELYQRLINSREYSREEAAREKADLDKLEQFVNGNRTGIKKRKRPVPKEKHVHGARRKATKIGRNDPCPCGSGKKYKKCCGR